MKFFKPIFLLLCLLITTHAIHAQKVPVLVSGQNIKNGNANGIGRLSPAFYNGYMMGFAQIKGQGNKDLFIQGTDAHGRGTYLYTFLKLNENGVPVFSPAQKIALPFDDKGENRGLIFQDAAKKVYGVWKFGNTLKLAEFDQQKLSFSALKSVKITGIPKGFSDFGILQLKDGKYLWLFSVAENGKFSSGRPFPQKETYTPEGFWPYDIVKAGVYGATSTDLVTPQITARQLTPLDQTHYSLQGFAAYREGVNTYALSGSRLGNILVYAINEKTGKLSEKKYAVDQHNILLRNPNVNSFAAYFYGSESDQGLVTQGEGGIYYYKNTRKFTKEGSLILEDPQPILQQSPDLYGGSLVVPSVADWDGDGKLDIISGTSMGFLFFFKNTGTNEQPQFIEPVPLKAGGEIIHVQPGYREDIQGPGEARWGYTCPNVMDWNGDGLLDILTGDSRGKFMVYLNKGTKTQPLLDAEHPLYLNGMDMYGTWRVKPGVGKMGNKMAYIVTDRDDEFHLYWQLDTYNLEDGGKLKINDSLAIRGNKFGGGTVGRSKIEIVDWDEDGKKDLIVGTYGKQSIPDTVSGLPFNMKPKRGSTVLFLKNLGTDLKPSYAYPKVIKFKGENISLGGHSCAPAVARIGPGNRLNLIVGIETGAYVFYDRKDLSW